MSETLDTSKHKPTLGEFRVQLHLNPFNISGVTSTKKLGAELIDATIKDATGNADFINSVAGQLGNTLKTLQENADSAGNKESARSYHLAQQQLGFAAKALAEGDATWAHTAFEIATMLAVKGLELPPYNV